MLEQMRDSSGSFIIWVLFAIIIAAFVLFFGSPSDSIGCGSSKGYALEVDGKDVSVNSWRFAYNGIPYVIGNVPADQRRPMAFELLLKREILAAEAEKLEFNVSTSIVNDAIQNGEFYLMGDQLDGSKFYFNSEDPNYPYFEYQYLENLVRGRLGLPSVDAYRDEERRELMAHFMKQELLRSAYVSKEEARQNFIVANTTVSAEYVKFETSKYRSSIKLSEAEVQSYADAHEGELKTEWEQVKPRWEDDKARVKVRIIKVARTIPASAKAPAATTDEVSAEDASEEPALAKTSAETSSDAPAPTKLVDPARTKLEELRATIAAGTDFATAAKSDSADASASLGGLIGWRSADSMGFGPEVVAASKDLKVGQVSKVIDADSAYYLVLIEERSDKGLSFEQKKFDLAIKSAPDTLAKGKAKAAAERALAQAATTPLSDLFAPASTPEPSFDLDNRLEQLTPEQLQKLMESAVPKSESGALYQEGFNRLAQLGGETAEEAPVTSRPKTPAPNERSVTPPVADGQASVAFPVWLDDEGVPAPALHEIVGTTRNGDFIAGLGRSKELVNDLFGVLAINELAGKVYSLSDSDDFVVIKLTDRTEADMERFAEQAVSLQNTLAEAKGGQILQNWVAEKCLKLKNAGVIETNSSLLVTGDDNKRIAYEPCSGLTATR